MNITALLGIVFIAAAAASLLKSYKPEYAVLVATVASAVILISVLLSIGSGLGRLKGLIYDSGINVSYFTVTLKALGICVITGFVSDICRDFGQTALAGRAEFLGKCAVFLISVPILSALLETAVGIIK